MTEKDRNRLQTCLRHYYDGVSTPDEEREMRRLLADPALPAEFAAERDMLRGFDSICPAVGFESRLSSHIDTLAGNSRMRSHRSGLLRLRWGVAAAVVALLCTGIGFAFGPPGQPRGSELTPEETREQVEMALTLFTGTLSRGYEEANKAEMLAESTAARAMMALSALSETTEETTE